MLSVPPLALQRVHHQDSVLGSLSAQPANGLTVASYIPLIQAAISDRFWDSDKLFDANKERDRYGNAGRIPMNTRSWRANFSLIWGLAIQLYESTLISDQSPFDDFMEGNDSALSDSEQAGMEVFLGAHKGQGGRCINCHQGPAFTGAAAPFFEQQASEAGKVEQLVERMRVGDGDNIEEDLFRYFIRGQGQIGPFMVSGEAGARELPNIWRATAGGDITLNGAPCTIESFLMNQDRTAPFPELVGDPPDSPVYRGTEYRDPGCGVCIERLWRMAADHADRRRSGCRYCDGPGNPADQQATTAVRSIADRAHRSADVRCDCW